MLFIRRSWNGGIGPIELDFYTMRSSQGSTGTVIQERYSQPKLLRNELFGYNINVASEASVAPLGRN